MRSQSIKVAGRYWRIRSIGFAISIAKAKNCLFSRRNGYYGKIVYGYSICLTLFGKVIFRGKETKPVQANTLFCGTPKAPPIPQEISHSGDKRHINIWG